tara:strand:+ start:13 stop:258 length:246 start_codon:yes stop_codon:yes gene_type:complete
MRAKTVIHVEYELMKAVINSKEIGMVIDRVSADMVPLNDPAAAKRFDNGVKSLAQSLQNTFVERRRHRIPTNHPDYRGKGE